MELTFKEYKEAYKTALKLVNLGRVRIERCYRLKQGLEVVYKLYFDCTFASDEVLEVLREHSDSYEEEFEDIKRVLIEKNRVLKEILNLLSERPMKLDDLRVNLENRGVSIDGSTLKVLIDELEENGYVTECGEIRLNKPL